MRYFAQQEGASTFILKDESESFEACLKVAKRRFLLVQELAIQSGTSEASIYYEKKGKEKLKLHCFDELECSFDDHTSGFQLYRKNDVDIWSRDKISPDYTELEIK